MNYYRDTWAEIDLSAIQENIASFRKHLPQKTNIMAVVKANAYGHGAYQVASAAVEAGATWLSVALMDEAIALRKQGIEEPILVMGVTRPSDVRLAYEWKISLTVFQQEWLHEASKQLVDGEAVNVHLKVDTGMGRIGARSFEDIQQVATTIASNPHFIFEGMFTHFATADELQSELVDQQFARFEDVVDMVRQMGVEPTYLHCGNSAASLRFPTKLFNIARIGIAMYGLTPSPEMKAVLPFSLKPALSLHTKLVHVKKVEPGDTVSYGATYVALKEEWIGTLPIGYADGWIRRYGENGEVLVQGKRTRFAGRICMDQSMIQLPHEMNVGETVTLIGRQGEAEISADDVARQAMTINYEISCLLTARVPRIYKKQGRILEKMNAILNF
ncbi:alanine racemase [Fictibacillus macauensis ZFHKF-1]|uniref:Alanine racemase n=1 Tax=Fictibacillus macauensis ZFHKF-1 TaxID=1196324 RepID=I8UKR6_9BACL|nr:alanine racemase [Fictibacillus macauensis]EIT87423.1 alanine racemase [Fictibacillus macauensis ZFHKF-1]